MKLRSLRARLIAGVLVWTALLLGVGFAVMWAVVAHNPRMSRIVHDGFVFGGCAVLTVAAISLIRQGLSPFDNLRERLSEVRSGRRATLEGEYPTEVEPLVSDLNALLLDRDDRIARAVARAGDLAHGLKTPLAVLMQDIARADDAGHHELASSMRQQVDRMRRQIDSHLASARASAGHGATATTSLDDAARGLMRTMAHLHAERGLQIETQVDPALRVRVPLEDVEEMLGNLLDNACKWARTQVSLSASRHDHVVVIHVDDDGAGLPAEARQRALQRGVRLDERVAGSGLGLAIVRDLAEAYGGTVSLDESSFGGVRAELRIPAA